MELAVVDIVAPSVSVCESVVIVDAVDENADAVVVNLPTLVLESSCVEVPPAGVFSLGKFGPWENRIHVPVWRAFKGKVTKCISDF